MSLCFREEFLHNQDPEPTFACRRPRAYLTRLAPFHTCEKGVP